MTIRTGELKTDYSCGPLRIKILLQDIRLHEGESEGGREKAQLTAQEVKMFKTLNKSRYLGGGR